MSPVSAEVATSCMRKCISHVMSRRSDGVPGVWRAAVSAATTVAVSVVATALAVSAVAVSAGGGGLAGPVPEHVLLDLPCGRLRQLPEVHPVGRLEVGDPAARELGEL